MRRQQFKDWLIKNRGLQEKPASDYVARVARIERDTLVGTDIDGYINTLENIAINTISFDDFLTLFTTEGKHGLKFKQGAELSKGLASIRTALNSYYEFWIENPITYASITNPVLTYNEIQSVDFKSIVDIFIWRLNTQERAYSINGTWFFYTPQIYNNSRFAELIGVTRYFKAVNEEQIYRTKLLTDDAGNYVRLRDVKTLKLVESNGMRGYNAELRSGKIVKVKTRKADGSFGDLVQERFSTNSTRPGEYMPVLASLSLDHKFPMQQIFEQGHFPGIQALSNIIIDIAGGVNSSIHRWFKGDMIKGVFDHPQFDKALALIVKQELDTISSKVEFEIMQKSENSRKGKKI